MRAFAVACCVLLAGCSALDQKTEQDPVSPTPNLASLKACPASFARLSPTCETQADPADVQPQSPLGFFCIARAPGDQGYLELMRTVDGTYGLSFDLPPEMGTTDLLLTVQRGETSSLLEIEAPTKGFVELGQGFQDVDTLGLIGISVSLNTTIPSVEGAKLTPLWAIDDERDRGEQREHLTHRIQLRTSEILYLDGHPPNVSQPTDLEWKGAEGTIGIYYALPVSMGFGMLATPHGSCLE